MICYSDSLKATLHNTLVNLASKQLLITIITSTTVRTANVSNSTWGIIIRILLDQNEILHKILGFVWQETPFLNDK